MAFIKTDCGTINSDGLLTVNIDDFDWGWCLILRYSGKKEDIQLTCKDEEQAKKCLEQVNNALLK